MSDFLLELRSEEIPARMQAGARETLEKLFRKDMDAAGVSMGEITVWSTPRRLTLIAWGLPVATAAVSEELKGPRVGAPPQALEGFLRKTGLIEDQLTARDGVLYAVTEKPGRATAEVLAEAIPAIIRAFPWPKSQRWGAASLSSESLRWVRPLSAIVALFGGAVVECEVGGVSAGRLTRGHRFHSDGEISIDGADDYAAKLRAAHVIVDHAERQDLIRTGAAAVAAAEGLVLVADEGLVVENAGLTEWPVPLLGRFDEAFLDVPPEVIQLTARTNQKYFVCEDGAGKLANAFVCTANIVAADGGVEIVAGNRKVLAARLSDARFFWEQDRQKTLAEHAEGLARITFHEKLGTVADKVERVAKLARWLVEEGIVNPREFGDFGQLGATPLVTPAQAGAHLSTVVANEAPEMGSRLRGNDDAVRLLADHAELAARLCKADLVTEMVGEFPELQGLMGGYYARAESLPDEVADAIRDHYKPVGQGDDVPTAPVTVAVSLADKLDTICLFFGAGKKPTGSRDPYALRRAALAAIEIITVNGLRGSIIDCLMEVRRLWLETLSDFPAFELLAFEEDDQAQFAAEPLDESYRASRIAYFFKDFSVSPGAGHWWTQRSLQDEENVVAIVVPPLEFVSSVGSFLTDRLKVQQREAGVRHDLIDAVFALGGEDDLVRLLARVHALQAFVGTEDGTNLLAGYKRAANILKKEGVVPANGGTAGNADASSLQGGQRSRVEPGTTDKSLSYTPEPAEKALIDELGQAGPTATAAVGEERFADAMAALATLRAPIDAFFEEVTVNDADPAKRTARLALLAQFRDAVHGVADFSKIEG